MWKRGHLCLVASSVERESFYRGKRMSGLIGQPPDLTSARWTAHSRHRSRPTCSVDERRKPEGEQMTVGWSLQLPQRRDGLRGSRWGVTFDNLGNLYGTASAGGDPTCSCGVIFTITPQANGKWSYSVLHRFKGTDGYGPGYNLIFDQGYKHLYGTAVAGGSGRYGVVYEITPSSGNRVVHAI
jgi:uncharacterized repeat protein (TIGR03803 family)